MERSTLECLLILNGLYSFIRNDEIPTTIVKQSADFTYSDSRDWYRAPPFVRIPFVDKCAIWEVQCKQYHCDMLKRNRNHIRHQQYSCMGIFTDRTHRHCDYLVFYTNISRVPFDKLYNFVDHSQKIHCMYLPDILSEVCNQNNCLFSDNVRVGV